VERRARFWERFVRAERSPALRYGVALLLACASLVLAMLFRGLEKADISSLALASVVLSAIYGGRGPALVDTAITAVGIDYLFTEPLYAAFHSWASAVYIVVHGLVGVLIADIVARLRDAYRDLRLEHEETVLAKRAREDVLAVVSHDLRSPLSAILLGAEYLRQTSRGELQDIAAGVQRSGRQMNRLIDDLLDAVRIEKGQLRIETARHDVGEIIEDALRETAAAAQAKAVRLVRAVPPGRHELECDRGRLAQALANLLGNAIKFSPEGAAVQLELHPEPDRVRLVVRDWGPGIPEEDLPLIFGRYWQAKDTAHQGTGLGLFIAKSIIEAHGGRIEVASRAGAGSVFTLYLPSGKV
jgi:signal transduction histidine kinase